MNPHDSLLASRRAFLTRACYGLGTAALGTMLRPGLLAAGSGAGLGVTPTAGRGILSATHHPARCKRVIFLYQAGGPSHLETFDPKPLLNQLLCRMAMGMFR